MRNDLPPDDQPSGRGLVSASDEEALADAMSQNRPGGAWWVALAFHNAATDEVGIQVDQLRALVTPESLETWGDFSGVRELLSDTGLTSRANHRAPGVAYVKFVSDTGRSMIADGHVMIMARAIATLQFRPELSEWRVHQLGDYCLPEDLPPL